MGFINTILHHPIHSMFVHFPIGLTAGAMLDYAAGILDRPPRWMIALGLEWFGRLMIEPRRLWKRYLIGIPVFLWHILMQKLGLLRFEE